MVGVTVPLPRYSDAQSTAYSRAVDDQAFRFAQLQNQRAQIMAYATGDGTGLPRGDALGQLYGYYTDTPAVAAQRAQAVQAIQFLRDKGAPKESPTKPVTTKSTPATNPSGSITTEQANAQAAKSLPLFGDQPINLRMFEHLMKVAPAPQRVPSYKDILGQQEAYYQLGQSQQADATQDAARKAAINDAIARRRLQLLTSGSVLDLPTMAAGGGGH